MNTKKIISVFAAMAIAASSFVGMTISASAKSTLPFSEDFEDGESCFTGSDANVAVIKATGTNLSSEKNGTTYYANDLSKVLVVTNGTATGTFDADDEEAGNQQYTISTGEQITVEYDAYHGYLNDGGEAIVTLYNSDNYAIASYTYNKSSGNISGITVANATPANFTENFSFASRYGSANANGFVANGNKPYVATAGYNPHISFTVDASGNVTLTLARTQGSINNAYTGTLGESVKKNIAYMTIYEPASNSDRTYAIDNLSITKTTATTTATFSVAGSDAAPTVNIYSDPEHTAAVSNGSLVVGNTYYYTAALTGYYDYSEGSFEVTAAFPSVVIPMIAKASYDVTVNAIGDITQSNVSTTSGYIGDNVNYYYPRYVVDDKIAYETDSTGSTYYGDTVSSIDENKSFDVEYSKAFEGVVFFMDFDDTNSDNAAARASNGKARFGAYDSGETTIPAGTYKYVIRYVNINDRESYVKVGDQTLLTTTDVAKGNWQDKTGEFTLAEAGSVTITKSGSSSGFGGFDTILIYKDTPIVTVTESKPTKITGTIPAAYGDLSGKLKNTSDKVVDVSGLSGMTIKTFYIRVENAVEGQYPVVTFSNGETTGTPTKAGINGQYFVYQYAYSGAEPTISNIEYNSETVYTAE